MRKIPNRLTANQAGKILGISGRQVRRHRASGVLKGEMLFNIWVFDEKYIRAMKGKLPERGFHRKGVK